VPNVLLSVRLVPLCHKRPNILRPTISGVPNLILARPGAVGWLLVWVWGHQFRYLLSGPHVLPVFPFPSTTTPDTRDRSRRVPQGDLSLSLSLSCHRSNDGMIIVSVFSLCVVCGVLLSLVRKFDG
jgi:hypothetical protein